MKDKIESLQSYNGLCKNEITLYLNEPDAFKHNVLFQEATELRVCDKCGNIMDEHVYSRNPYYTRISNCRKCQHTVLIPRYSKDDNRWWDLSLTGKKYLPFRDYLRCLYYAGYVFVTIGNNYSNNITDFTSWRTPASRSQIKNMIFATWVFPETVGKEMILSPRLSFANCNNENTSLEAYKELVKETRRLSLANISKKHAFPKYKSNFKTCEGKVVQLSSDFSMPALWDINSFFGLQTSCGNGQRFTHQHQLNVYSPTDIFKEVYTEEFLVFYEGEYNLIELKEKGII